MSDKQQPFEMPEPVAWRYMHEGKPIGIHPRTIDRYYRFEGKFIDGEPLFTADQWRAAYEQGRGEFDAVRVERDHYAMLFNASKLGHEQAFERCRKLSELLRRSLMQLGAWQRKYGEHNPEWLPPAGDVILAEDIDTALKDTTK